MKCVLQSACRSLTRGSMHTDERSLARNLHCQVAEYGVQPSAVGVRATGVASVATPRFSLDTALEPAMPFHHSRYREQNRVDDLVESARTRLVGGKALPARHEDSRARLWADCLGRARE